MNEHERLLRKRTAADAPASAPDAVPGRTTRVAEGGMIYRKAQRDDAGVAPGADAAVAAASGSAGNALPGTLRSQFERSLGADLSGVRIHTGGTSAAAAAAVGAKAYAVGQDIHFAAGQFDPSSSDGQRLLAHEVAHTVQQHGGAPTRQHKLEVSRGADAAEVEADAAAEAMVSGRAFTMSRAPIAIARKPEPTAGVSETDEESDGPAKTPAEALADLEKECTDATPTIEPKLAAQAVAIRAAFDKFAPPDVFAALNAAITAADELDGLRNRAGIALDRTYVAEKGKPEWNKANAAQVDYEKAIGISFANLQVAMTVDPARPADKVVGLTALRARANVGYGQVTGSQRLATRTTEIGAMQGKPRLVAAEEVRQILLSITPGERTYAMRAIKAVNPAPDILDYYQGNGAALRAAGGGLEVGSGGNASAEAGAQGAHSPAPMPLQGKAKIDPKTGTGKLDGPKVTADPSSGAGGITHEGEVGKNKNGDPYKLSGGPGVDVRAADGSFRFEGAKFEGGFTTPGNPVGTPGLGEQQKKSMSKTAKAGVSFTQVISPPTFDGIRWSVAWTVTSGASGGGGAATSQGVSAGGDVKLSGALVRAGSKVFDTAEAAKAFYDAPSFILDDKALDQTLPDAKAMTDLKEGETVSVGHNGSIAASGTVTPSAVGPSLGAGGSVGDTVDAKVTRVGGQKIQATFRDVTTKGGSGSVGGSGMAVSAGGGTGEAVSITVEFDLATDEGKAAYNAWATSPGVAPKPGPGVRVLSRGKGSFSSTNIGLSGAATVVNGTGTNTSTTGEFTETTEDGKHNQATVVGSQTDATKGFNPVNPNQQSRTDSMEITTTDGDTANATFVVKTSIQSQADAKWANAELGALAGEPSKVGTTLDGGLISGEKSSGTTGKWSTEGSYTKAQIDDFLAKVAAGKIVASVKNAGALAALKQTLLDPKVDDKAKQRALAKWFADSGPEATSQLRDAIGPPNMNIALEGDKYLTGSAGQAQFDGKRIAFEDRLLKPDLSGDEVTTLLRDIQALYVELLEKRDHVANPVNYPELPHSMRHQIVLQVQANCALLAALRQKASAKAKDLNVGDTGGNATLNKKILDVRSARAAAAEQRSAAVDGRAKHAGALSAGRDNPRQILMARHAGDNIGAAYKLSDQGWQQGLDGMTAAEAAERELYTEPCLAASSQDKAIAAADKSIESYRKAGAGFKTCAAALLQIYKAVTPAAAYDKSAPKPPDSKHPSGLSDKDEAKRARNGNMFDGYADRWYGTQPD
jgi:hypothetical protein